MKFAILDEKKRQKMKQKHLNVMTFGGQSLIINPGDGAALNHDSAEQITTLKTRVLPKTELLKTLSR